jgi:prefoldin subunit 5
MAPNPTLDRLTELDRAQAQLEAARKEVCEVEDTVRSLRAELAERNRRLVQLSNVLKVKGQPEGSDQDASLT